MRLRRKLSKDGAAALANWARYRKEDKKDPSIQWIAVDTFRIWSMDAGEISHKTFVIKEVAK
jgi:hypothetical protein